MTYPKDFFEKVALDRQLTDKQVEVLWVIFGEGLSRVQAAQKLHISDGALRERLSQIYRAFRLTKRTDKKESLLKSLLAEEYLKYQKKDSSSVEASLETLVDRVRFTSCPKIEHEYGKIRLLNGKRIDARDLYVDVYLLEELSSKCYENKAELLQYFELEGDRLALGHRKERYRGLDIAKSDNYSKLFVLGKPGAGKSTFLQNVAISCCGGIVDGEKFLPRHIPVFIELRAVELDDFDLFHQVHLEFSLNDIEETQELLNQGRTLLLLDGLDEVPNHFQEQVHKQIKQFSKKYHRNRFILTCRTQASTYDYHAFEYLEVADFNDEQIDIFIQQWFKTISNPQQQEELEDLRAKLIKTLDENKPVAELAITPILLSLTCIVFQKDKFLPLQKSELYNRGLYLLLEQWDKERGIQRKSGSRLYENLSVYEKQKLLSEIAATKFQHPQDFVLFDQEEIESFISSYLCISSIDAHIVLCSIEIQHGLLIERVQQIWSFSHLTFQEYLTAQHIVRNWDERMLIVMENYMIDKRWREVFLLVSEMLDGVDQLIIHMKNKIDTLITDHYLFQFLEWTFQKSNSTKCSYHAAAIRAYYFALCRAIDDDRQNLQAEMLAKCDLASLLGFQRNIALGKDMNSLLKRLSNSRKEYVIANFVPDLAIDDYLINTLGNFIFLNERFDDAYLLLKLNLNNTVSHPNIKKSLKRAIDNILQQLPDVKEKELFNKWWHQNGQSWMTQFRNMLTKHRNIGHDWQFDNSQKKQLQEYYNTSKLLVECLNVAKRNGKVSLEFFQEVTASLLLPPSYS